mmetsp:Transcript_17176/g.2834  ORF Transcript_17176/g.2834 Transcript_17176/m.2834 type:complete len:97 (-) Transcript_17176:321-611(-)
MACGESDQDHLLMICDGANGQCGNTYHTFCVGLSEVSEDWLCPECISLQEFENENFDDLIVDDSESDSNSDVITVQQIERVSNRNRLQRIRTMNSN